MTIRLNTKTGTRLTSLISGLTLAIATTCALADAPVTDSLPAPAPSLPAAPPVHPAAGDTVLARAGDSPITVKHLMEFVRADPNMLSTLGSIEGRAKILGRLIEGRLLNLAAMERAQLKPDAGRDAVLQAVTRLETDEFAPDAVTEEQLQAAYARRMEEFGIPASVRIREIYFPFPEGADADGRAAARERAEAALQRAQAGEPFESLATELAHLQVLRDLGGDQGYLALYQYPHLKTATAGMTEGGLSGVLELPGGYQIFQFIGRREAILVAFDSVKDRLRRELMAESQAQKKTKFLRDYAKKVGVVVEAPELRAAWPADVPDAPAN